MGQRQREFLKRLSSELPLAPLKEEWRSWAPCSASFYCSEGKWQPTPIFLPGELHGQRSLAGYSPWGRKESDSIERLIHTLSLSLSAGTMIGFLLLSPWQGNCDWLDWEHEIGMGEVLASSN